MIRLHAAIVTGMLAVSWGTPAFAQTNAPDKPTWWAKYQYLTTHGPDTSSGQAGVQTR